MFACRLRLSSSSLAILLLALGAPACTAGSSDDPSSTTDDSELIYRQSTEVQVSGPGDAEVSAVVELAGGGSLVKVGDDVRKRLKDGSFDAKFRPAFSPQDASLYLVDGGKSYILAGALGQISKQSVDTGDVVAEFGKNGVATVGDYLKDLDVAASTQAASGEISVAMVEARNRVSTGPSSYMDYGPSTIGISTLDPKTGALTKKQLVNLPKSTSSNGVRVRRLVATADGAEVLVASVTEDGPRTRFVALRVTESGVAPPVELVAGDYDRAALLAAHAQADGSVAFVFGGDLDSPVEAASKLVRVSLAADGAVTPDVLADADAPSTSGLGALRCGPVVAASGDDFVALRSRPGLSGIQLQRFAPGHPARSTSSRRTNRCVRGIFPQPSGAIYASAWDTTDYHAYRHVLARLD